MHPGMIGGIGPPVTEVQRQPMFAVGNDLCDYRGADAILLTGTDLFLVFDGQDCGFPVIDGALAQIDALLQRARAFDFPRQVAENDFYFAGRGCRMGRCC